MRDKMEERVNFYNEYPNDGGAWVASPFGHLVALGVLGWVGYLVFGHLRAIGADIQAKNYRMVVPMIVCPTSGILMIVLIFSGVSFWLVLPLAFVPWVVEALFSHEDGKPSGAPPQGEPRTVSDWVGVACVLAMIAVGLAIGVGIITPG